MAYQEKAHEQGVERPFEILLRMGEDSRRAIADLLGIDLGQESDPGAQAWTILNRDIRGLQARTHYLPEMLSPFSRNNNWWEIVTRTASWMKVKFYPGVSEREIERLIFDNVASKVIEKLDQREITEIDRRIDAAPVLAEALSAAGVSQDGMRFIFLGRQEAAAAPAPVLPSLTRGMALILERLKQIFSEWFHLDKAKQAFNHKLWCLAGALSALYLQDLIEENLEEFRAVRA